MSLSRRSFLLGTAALALTAGPGDAQFAASPAPLYFSSIKVDVGHLHALRLGPFAEFLRAALLAETRRAFADRLGRSGPTLVVRITGVSMRSYAGSGRSAGGGGGADHDYLEGEALVVGRRGEILGRYPQLSALPSSSGGAWYDPASEPRRTAALAQHYAAWLRRTIGG